MKYLIIFLLFICSTYISYSQNPVKIDIPPATAADTSKMIIKDSTISEAEVQPDFQNGKTGWRHFLERNLDANVPYNNKAPKGTYTVVIQFVVYADGNIDKLEVLTQHGYGMENEVLRILKKAPKWKPGIQNGEPVNAYKKQSVVFVVQ